MPKKSAAGATAKDRSNGTTMVVRFLSKKEYYDPSSADFDESSDEATELASVRDAIARGGKRLSGADIDKLARKIEPFYQGFLDLDAVLSAEREDGTTWGDVIKTQVVEIGCKDKVTPPGSKPVQALTLDHFFFDEDASIPTSSGTMTFLVEARSTLTREDCEAFVQALDENIGTPQFSWVIGGEAFDAQGSEGGSGFELVSVH